jgi:hypothetical protein
MTLKLITVKNVYVHHQNDGTLLYILVKFVERRCPCDH